MAVSSAITMGKNARARTLAKLKNHTVVLGWSNKVFTILSELEFANLKKPRVVLVSNLETLAMQSHVEKRLPQLKRLKISYISAETSNEELLKSLNLGSAKSVIVLNNSETAKEKASSTIAAVRKVSATVNIVTDLSKEQNGGEDDNVRYVDSAAVSSSVIAQASRSENLLGVFTDLLNFNGDEIYFASIPALSGKTYSDAILAFNFASVIGLVEAGVTRVNPAMNTVLTAETKIIAIASEASSVIYTGVRQDVAESKVVEKVRPVQPPASLLFIGWSAIGRQALAQLDGFLEPKSRIHIIARQEHVNQNEIQNLKFENLEVSVQLIDKDQSELDSAKNLDVEKIVILGYRETLDAIEADSVTREVSERVRLPLTSQPEKFGQARIIFTDIVAEDVLPAMVMAQLSQNPQLDGVFADLFDAQGASLNFRAITDYASVGQTVTMAELAATARNFGESAIGYRFAKSGEVVLNPAKIWEVSPEQGDQLLIVGNQ